LTINKDLFPTSELEAQGINPVLIQTMMKKITKSKIHSVIIIKNGYRVLEWFRHKEDKPSHICSCTKSISSALIGIALDKGIIDSIEHPVLDYFPNASQYCSDERVELITIRHLLEMRAGFDWVEFPRLDSLMYTKMRQSRDWIKYILQTPMKYAPGEAYNYNTGNSHLLSVIINKATGSNAMEFAKENLFGPMGIKDFLWYNNKGVYEGGTMLKLKTADMAKFGVLYLNKGNWFGKQLISEAWVEESTTKKSEGHKIAGPYGYHWWTINRKDNDEREYFFAMGFGGQFIFVHPKTNTVAAFTSSISRTNPDMLLPKKLWEEYIIEYKE
jgi:CubicO group peptidase (beta-lactamase class C family)